MTLRFVAKLALFSALAASVAFIRPGTFMQTSSKRGRLWPERRAETRAKFAEIGAAAAA